MGELRAGLQDLVAAAWPDWMDEAACAGVDQDIFYPERGESYEAARRVCARCPVTDECLEHALEIGDTLGMWGGLTPDQRYRLADERGLSRRRGTPAVS